MQYVFLVYVFHKLTHNLQCSQVSKTIFTLHGISMSFNSISDKLLYHSVVKYNKDLFEKIKYFDILNRPQGHKKEAAASEWGVRMAQEH